MATKKKTAKTNGKKPAVKKPKKKVLAVAAPDIEFRVELAKANVDPTTNEKTWEYIFNSSYPTEEAARQQMEVLQQTGLGGRIINHDTGEVVVSWASPSDVQEAKAIEKGDQATSTEPVH